MRNALSKPGILIALFKVGTAAASLGFLQTTLEPHLHDLKPPLSSFQVGALFMVVGGTYGLSLPLWGWLCDSQLTKNSPKFVEVIGAVLIGSGFLVLGKSLIFLPELPTAFFCKFWNGKVGLHQYLLTLILSCKLDFPSLCVFVQPG